MFQFGLNGLTTLNIELTSICNKKCWMCGRRKVEREYPELIIERGEMDFDLVKSISEQLPPNIVIQFHKDGEGLLYPKFGEAVSLFNRQIKCLTTNGKLLVTKAKEIIDNLDTLALSVIQNDPEGDEQFEIIKEFLSIRGNRKPFIIYRLLGNIDSARYEKLEGIVARRVLHSPMGSFGYQKRNPTIPEIGICLDLLNHLVINNKGEVSVCVRFDPEKLGVIGNAKNQTLQEIWNGPKRQNFIKWHKNGKRERIPICAKCEFWGVPTSF